MEFPSGEKATSWSAPVPGSVAGFEYLAPNPAELQGYAVTKGVMVWQRAMAFPLGEKLIPNVLPGGRVAGSEYFAPKPPDVDHG